MKGACLLSESSSLYEDLADVLVRSSFDSKRTETCLQISDRKGRLFTLFAPRTDGIEPFDEVELAEMAQSLDRNRYRYPFLVECRWPDLFCEVLRYGARESACEFFVIDNQDRIHVASDLDQEKINL